MAHQVVWLRAALDDLDGIADYIAQDSPSYASVVVKKILDMSRDLADFPQVGRAVPEWGDASVRERLVYSYRLIYRVQDGLVTILGVIHGARLLPEDVRSRD